MHYLRVDQTVCVWSEPGNERNCSPRVLAAGVRPLLLLHQGAEAGLGDEAPHRVQLQWAVTSQPWCGPASPPPPVEADIGVDSEGGTVGRQVRCLPGDLIVYYVWS